MLRNVVMRSPLAIVAVASALVVAACGSKQSAPSAPSTPAPAAQQAAAGSATISGTVVGMTPSSQIKAQRTNLNVTVTGSSAVASVDDSGRFTLTNVPAGHIDLHFTGIGIDAHLTLDVAERSTLVIVVRVSGNDAHLEDNHNGANPGADHDNDNDDDDDANNDDANEVELKGTIATGSLTGACASNTLSFAVNTTRVNTNASTQFKDTACTSLKAGDSVEVKGTRQANASVLAKRVERKK